MSKKPSLEREVIEVLWDRGEVSVRDVLARLPHEYAYTTILTVLDRLHTKGVVEREKVEGAWHYRPTRSRVATLAQALASILDEARENPEPVYLAFLDHAQAVSPDALDRLEAMIQARRRSG